MEAIAEFLLLWEYRTGMYARIAGYGLIGAQRAAGPIVAAGSRTRRHVLGSQAEDWWAGRIKRAPAWPRFRSPGGAAKHQARGAGMAHGALLGPQPRDRRR